MRWLATDKIASGLAQEWRDPGATGNSLALLQYTSGSTAIPRGVMVSHGNLIHNSAHISRAFEITTGHVSVTWLPVFHDMGLTNGIIQPLYQGTSLYPDAAAVLSSAAGAMAAGYFAIQSHDQWRPQLRL